MDLRDAARLGQPALSQPDPDTGGRQARCLVVVGSRRDSISLFPVVEALHETRGIDPEHLLFDGPAPASFGGEGTWSLPAQREPESGPDHRASESTTHAYAELSALAHCTNGSLRPVRRGQQDR